MKPEDWKILAVGDYIRHPKLGVYHVARIEAGVVLAVQLAGTRTLAGGVELMTTHTAKLTQADNEWERLGYRDKGHPTAAPRVAVTGRFVVDRVDGSQEVDECPGPIEKSRTR